MNYKTYLLIKLGEEAAEVSQAAAKLLLFGEVSGEYQNLRHLEVEIIQLSVVWELLTNFMLRFPELPASEVDKVIEDKKESLRYHYNLALEAQHAPA